jgi:hypothetical protein
MATAADQVFGIPELRELILLQLPMTDLFRSQRVCQPWRQTILHSKSFLRPMWYLADHQSLENEYSLNPILFSNGFQFELDRYYGRMNSIPFEVGKVSLARLIDYEPGPWTTTLVVQPPAKYFEVCSTCDEGMEGNV